MSSINTPDMSPVSPQSDPIPLGRMLRDMLWRSTSPKKTSNAANPNYEELILGVWRVLIIKDSRVTMFNFRWEELSATFQLLRRAIHDVYTINPRLFVIYILAQFWLAIEPPLSLYLSNRMFFFIEKRVSGDSADSQISSDLVLAVVCNVICSMINAYMEWSSQKNEDAYSSCIEYEFQARLFSAKLRCDIPTSQDLTSKSEASSIFRCLATGVYMMKSAISFLLHLQLIIHLIGNGLMDGGPVFVALCMLPLFVRQLQPGDLWTKAYVVNAANKFFIRKSALDELTDTSLKQEIIAGGISNFLISEYHKAKDGLGDTPDTGPEILYSRQREALSNIITTLCSDGPTLYFAFLAFVTPSRLSIAQLAALNQTSSSLRWTFSSIGWSLESWPGMCARMGNLYSELDVKNKVKDGETPYPRPSHETGEGMGIEFEDVSFSYPNSKSERTALVKVSFTIQPGQLVVVVGANGSGKSTIIKLLSRFYDHTSGTIRIDGVPIEEYKMAELRKSIAILTQEHQLYPLSVEENIRLGSSDAEAMNDEQKIKESVSAAGAEGVLKNFSKGYDTVLEPVKNGYVSFAGQGNKELEAMHKKQEKTISISGGEKQKLVAARTFMRLFTSDVKLVTVDEPSSALDPEAEYRLFANLRKEHNGRTMMFVTHRFGHLTKYADLIICIKDGTVVETGTHTDLLSNGGEYARLYNVQAQAFTTV